MVGAVNRPRLTWRNEPNEQGLSSIGQGPRGRIGKVNGEDVMTVDAWGGSALGGPLRGWVWMYADNNRDTPVMRSWDTLPLYETKEAAQAAATEWFKANKATTP